MNGLPRGPVVVLLLRPEGALNQRALRETVEQVVADKGVSTLEGHVIHDRMSLEEVHGVMRQLSSVALGHGAGIWLPNPESTWCRSNREAVAYVATLSSLMGVDVYCGLGFHPLKEHSAHRASMRASSAVFRSLATLRGLAIEMAASSLISACIAECVSSSDDTSKGAHPEIDLEVNLLRRIGMNDGDILQFINSISAATRGKQLHADDLPRQTPSSDPDFSSVEGGFSQES